MSSEEVILKTFLQQYQQSLDMFGDNFKRVHERLDDMVNKQFVPLSQCEKYRGTCSFEKGITELKNDFNSELDEIKTNVKTMQEEISKKVSEIKVGWPPWITITTNILSTLLTALIIYILTTKGH